MSATPLTLLILWVLVAVVLVLVIYFGLAAAIAWQHESIVIIPPPAGQCVRAFDTLPQLDDTLCCFIGESLTASRYVSSLDMVVNPIATGYLGVCQQFCTNGVSPNDPQTCINGNGQEAFSQCVALARPVNCTGPSMPVVALGTTYFYPRAAGLSSCQDQRPC